MTTQIEQIEWHKYPEEEPPKLHKVVLLHYQKEEMVQDGNIDFVEYVRAGLFLAKDLCGLSEREEYIYEEDILAWAVLPKGWKEWTDEQISELLATKVLCLTRGRDVDGTDCYYKDGVYFIDYLDWSPLTNIEQALMCWFKFRKYLGDNTSPTYKRIADTLAFSIDLENMTMAICLALVEAVEK